MWLSHYSLKENEQKLVDMSDEEFDKYMMSNYADMFIQRNAQEGQEVIVPMMFGFEIGKGWSHVLDNLCSKLKVIQALTGYVCVFDQIKEKFGGARFYYHIDRVNKNIDAKDDDKAICKIIDDLVNLHENYCDYVCEELGTNIDPEEKVVVGRWYYGMGIEGFKKCAEKSWPDSFEDRIESAEKYLERRKKEHKIKNNFYELNDEELNNIDELVNKYIDDKNESEK